MVPSFFLDGKTDVHFRRVTCDGGLMITLRGFLPTKRALALWRLLRLFSLLLFLPATLTVAQSASIWTGTVSCQLDDEEQGVYQRQEIQTWTLTGGAASAQGSMPVYPATWAAQAQGQLLRAQGAQTTSIQWVANVPQPGGQQPSASLVIFVRASDNRLVIKQWHSTLSVPNAISAQRQVFVNGAPQGQPAAFNRALSEWQFPLIEASPSDTTITGSSPAQADAGSAELVHHYGGMPPSATCQWQLTKGGNGGAPSGPSLGNGYPGQNPQTFPGNVGSQSNAQNCESPATVQQSFEAMKADIKSQYDKLIQGTSNPAEVASLTSQEQKTLASLNNQERHDMTLASQGCLQATNSQGNNSYSGSSPNGGSRQYAGNNPNTGGAPNSGINPNTGVNPNGGSSQYAGNPNAGSAPSGSTGSSGQTSTPQLLSLSPTSVSQGSTIPVRLTGQGTHWQSQITNVSFGPQITVQSFIADSSGTSGTANIAVAADASTGARPVMLMTGAELVGLPSGLSVTASTSQQGSGSSGTGSNSGTKFGTPNHQVSSMAMLTGVSPATNNGQQNVTVTLTGQFTHFSPGATTVSFAR